MTDRLFPAAGGGHGVHRRYWVTGVNWSGRASVLLVDWVDEGRRGATRGRAWSTH